MSPRFTSGPKRCRTSCCSRSRTSRASAPPRQPEAGEISSAFAAPPPARFMRGSRPPASSPITAPLATQPSVLVAQFKGYRIHVVGDPAQMPDQLARSIQKAESLSHLVHIVSTAYYIDGFPAAKTLYVLSGRDLYVMVVPQRVVEIKAGPPFFAYFESMTAEDPLTVPNLERRRVLASLHADRAHLIGDRKSVV